MFDYPESYARLDFSDGEQQVVKPATVVMVPDFIMRAIKLHKLNVIDIQNYDLISKVCSLDDLALWSAINRMDYKGTRFTGEVDNMFKVSNTTFLYQKTTTIAALSFTEEAKTASHQFMHMAADEETPFYELKSIGRAILVVVQPGFLYRLEKSDTVALDFIRELIKATETATNPSMAADSGIFKTFLKLTTSTVS